MTTLDTEKLTQVKRFRYSRAPITEAILDIRLVPQEGVTSEDLAKVGSELTGYGDRQELHLSSFEFQIAPGPDGSAATNTTEFHGYLYRSEDKRQIVQMRLDGFTLSRLWPYHTWEEFSGEAKLLWALYKEVVKPVRVERLAVRYVNKLDLPLPFNDFKEFLRTVPELSPDMQQGLSRYVMQLQSPQIDIDADLVLNQTLLPVPPDAEKASILLDIDLFRTADFGTDDQVIWEYFEILHARKNQIFEASITDKMRKEIS